MGMQVIRRISIVVIIMLATILPSAMAAPRPPDRGGKPGGGSGKAWHEDFSKGQLDTRLWMVASYWAPGYLPGVHVGYYDPANVTLQGGNLVLKLRQETGDVDGNPDGVISYGALVSTKKKYGYGTYEWRMRMSSTATSEGGAGGPVSGSVSAGFIYVNNSETEIDFEFSGDQAGTTFADTLWMVNWYNPTPATGPTENDETYTSLYLPGLTGQFNDFKFVWEPGKITFYVNGVLQAMHTTDVPSAPAYFMINHWGTNSTLWGGPATLGVDRYFYIDWVKYTPLP